MQFDALIFDLDGTLWDAAHATAQGWNNGLEEAGLGHLRVSARQVTGVLGLPFSECVARLFPTLPPASLDGLPEILDRHERLAVQELGGTPCAGVEEALPALQDAYPLLIVSNCQSWYLEAFLSGSGLGGFFSGWECHGTSGLPKARNIALVAERHGLQRPVYVGDTATDQQAAREAGVAFLFAAWGFGEPEGECTAFSSFAELAAGLLTAT
ncbi:MAG: HAD family hydrolase [SAR324 cluster bacterium]|nr:HAD family hydrolase [SAR324 cluster bacterium]